MKPGNLRKLKVPNPAAKTKDEDLSNSRIGSSVCGFFYEKDR